MALTGIYGAVSHSQATETIKAALDAGITLFDTAPLYGEGANEELLGEVLGGLSEATIVTKFGLYAGLDGKLARDSRPATIRRSVESSLKRLRRERVDLLLQHRPDPEVPADLVGETVDRLIAEGKVAAFGLSGIDTQRATAWPLKPMILAVQNELSLAKPDADVEAVVTHGAVFMAFAPLGRGILTGTRHSSVGDLRSTMPEFAEGRSGPSALEKLGANPGIPRAAAALSWVLSRSEAVVAIPGCKSPAQVEELASIISGQRPTLPPLKHGIEKS